jgi:EAL domain-containing protein (putative c-di-GMP-specific phosphodiesterase class I)
VRDTVQEHRLPAEALVLEVTETAVLHDVSAARRSLAALRRIGVGLALDDFGTGYSSLTFLRQLPVTHLKIDRSFVSQIAIDDADRAIAECIIELARRLGIRVIAEGVETAEQLTTLRQLGCAAGQGYHWSRPVPLERLAELLRATGEPAFPRQGTATGPEARASLSGSGSRP